MTKKELWLRIKNYHFEHLVEANLMEKIKATFTGNNPFAIAFADKISRKHNFNKRFALKCVLEYKKFIYLGIISKFHVTPSKYIDIVWHEHLLFTKAYKEFCNIIIEQEFHHFPELIPFDEQTNSYNTQFIATTNLYFYEFGIEPPKKIWGIAKYEKEQTKLDKESNTDTIGDEPVSQYTKYDDDTPLHNYFSSSEINTSDFSEFNDQSGEFAGAGATGSWGDSDNSDSSDSSGCSGGCSSGCGGGGD